MNIAVNTLSVSLRKGGTKTYLVNLIKSLAKVDNKNTYFLIVSLRNKTLFQKLGEKFKIIALPFQSDNRLLRLFYEQFVFPYYVRKHNISVLFSPNNIASLFPHCKQVLTFHAPLMIRKLRKQYAPKEVSKLQAMFYDLKLALSVSCSNRIIVVSENIKQWLLQQVNIPASKLNVIYEGVDCELFQSANNAKTSSIKQPYILFLSTLFRYKNAENLIQAFSKLKKTYKIPHILIIVGKDPKKQIGYLKQLAKSEGIFDNVIFTGAVSYDKVNSLYLNSDIFVFPSAVETFGLPVLEAMACGTPVVASNRTSVPEIVGDAGVIVNPDDIDELAEAILRVLSDKELQRSLIQKGYRRAKQFSWDKTARKTLEVFEEVFKED